MQTSHSRGNLWLRRLVKSNWFACGLSIGLHGIIFIVLYQVVFQEAVQPQRHIIPEARLAAGPSAQPPQSTIPLKLTRESPPADNDKPELDELPIAAITFDEAQTEPAPQLEPTVDLSLSSAISETASGPTSSFFGIAGNAYKIVYVVDTSASLMIYINEIVREMRQSVRGLIPTQRFHIALAKPGEVVEFSPQRLVPANGKYKSQAMAFIDSIKGIPQPGKADPIEAMRRAFAVRPELIYFLTDGDYPDIQEELERTLKQLNPNQATKITTIGFDPSPLPRALLERISRNHGGNFRMVVLK